MEEVLAAADRLRRTRAGYDLPAWDEPERPAKDAAARLDRSCPAADQPARGPDRQQHPSASRRDGSQPAPNPQSQDPATLEQPDEDLPAQDPPDEDPLAEDELHAAETDAMPPMSSPEIAGHVRSEPGPGLASWLGQARPGQQDEAGLVNSITGWRKLTSWAQAQELAAVAELGRRRGVMDDPERDRDPVRELSAEFAPNEVALALTLTQCAAEWWLNLAVSMSGRLPATWSALSEGAIDLARAKLIDLWTTPLDDDLAGAVERKVLVRARHQTTGQLRASLQRAVISVDPSAAERRRTQAEKNARVELSGEESGTAELAGHFLPAAQASAAWARINAMAEAMKGHGAGGGIDLLRAQVFIGLLLGTLPQPPTQAAPGNPAPPGTSPDGDGPSPGGDPPRAGGGPPPGGGPPRAGGGPPRAGRAAVPRGPAAVAPPPGTGVVKRQGTLRGRRQRTWPRTARTPNPQTATATTPNPQTATARTLSPRPVAAQRPRTGEVTRSGAAPGPGTVGPAYAEAAATGIRAAISTVS